MTTSETAPPLPPVQPVKLALTPFGTGSVEVDGKDLSNDLKAVQLIAEVGQPTTVVLSLMARAGAEFDGFARVVVGEDPDPGPAAAAFLAAMDPKILEEAALNRPDLDNEPHATTRAILRQLQEWASGRP